MARSSSSRGRRSVPPKLEATKRKIRGWNAFVDLLVGGLRPVEALVWAVLFRHATDGVVTRSNALLAHDLRVSDKTIRRAITALRKAGLLHVVQQGGMHVGASTYRLAVRDMKRAQPEDVASGSIEPEPLAASATPTRTEPDAEPEPSAGHRWVSMAVTAMTDITDNRTARGPDGSPVPLQGL